MELLPNILTHVFSFTGFILVSQWWDLSNDSRHICGMLHLMFIIMIFPKVNAPVIISARISCWLIVIDITPEFPYQYIFYNCVGFFLTYQNCFCALSLPSLWLINTNLSWNAATVNWGESDVVTNAFISHFVFLSLSNSL